MPVSADYSHISFVSAGAGSGKTYRLTEELERALTQQGVRPAAVIATTFTVKAASELTERVRERLIAGGHLQLAEQAAEALIGTVHSVCERLLRRFAFDLGLSPRQNVLSVEDGQRIFNQALDDALEIGRVRHMNAVSARLELASWQYVVKEVADKARENDISSAELAAMGAANADDLLAYFGAPLDADPTGSLRAAVAEARRTIDPLRDATKATASYLERLEVAERSLPRANCPWSVWIGLAVAGAAKASEPIAAAVREQAEQYVRHPGLHADIRDYLTGVFEIAALTLDRFRRHKLDRGLIDFLDMEQLMLRALDDADVRERIGEDLDLLLVDEFQDTNPMQLALFVRLAGLARRVVFVGDVKQAIYEFRGCDPDLVFRTLADLAAGAAITGKLERNWRSRPDLVSYVNEVFAAAFEGVIDRDAVVLEPAREDGVDTPAVNRWRVGGVNRAERDLALAAAVADLVASGVQVVDPESDVARPVRFGDIAVLARTNNHVEAIARSLRSIGVPMKMTLRGLLAVAEVGLARACLRRLNDDSDTLAAAEIVALSDGGEPEDWLADRLRWLQDGRPSHQWATLEHPIVRRLAELADGVALQSPVEVVARVLNDVGVRRVVTAWGPDVSRAAQRQRNIDAFLNLAVEYERHCDSQHQAATLTGFLFWLENPTSAELDLQPVVTTGNAVHVLTYHRAKGLEWPVVITTDFDGSDRSSLWDTRVHLDAPFSVETPLANRRIRLWPDLFKRRSRNVPVLDAIFASAEGQACRSKDASEQARLAYVGITRARDVLVLALPEAKLKADAWLRRFDSGFAVPDGDSMTLPNGVVVASTVAQCEPSGVRRIADEYKPRWFQQRPHKSPLPGTRVSPSAAAPSETAEIGEIVEFGERIRLGGGDMAAVGNGLHGVLGAELVNPGRADADKTAAGLLRAHGVDAFVRAGDTVAAARRFSAAIEERFQPSRVHVEFPVSHVLPGGAVVSGWIDVALETADGWIVIDHKSSPRPRSEWAQEALEYSGQLAAYRAALEAAGCRVAGTWIHLVVTGVLLEVKG